MPNNPKKIRIAAIDPDIDRQNFIHEVQFKHKDCTECKTMKEWMECDFCLGPKGPSSPIVILPVAESKAEKKKRFKGYFKKSGENKAMRKIKKEIKLGKQSTIKQFFGLSKK